MGRKKAERKKEAKGSQRVKAKKTALRPDEKQNNVQMVKESEQQQVKKKPVKEAMYFTETHEWIKVCGDEAYVGLTDFAVKKLTDLVHIELPEVGDEIVQGSSFGSVESVKAVSDLNAPVSGKVREVNEEVISNLDIVSKEPYDEGWLIKISISDATEFDSLMSKKDYENYIKTIEEEEE